MEYKFILNPDTDSLEIDEPLGFDSFEISIVRDDKFHGISEEASTNTLRFYGPAATFLQNQKELYGLKANVIFQVLTRCDESQDYDEILIGRLNFGKYRRICGNVCYVQIPWEKGSCEMVFNSRWDQKVDIDKNTAFDGSTALPEYDALGFELSLPARDLLASVDGSVDQDVINLDGVSHQVSSVLYVRPTYNIQRYNNIITGNLIPASNWESSFSGNDDIPITPQLLYEDSPTCFDGNFDLSVRLKGSYSIISDADIVNATEVKLRVFSWDGQGLIFSDSTLIYEANISAGLPNNAGNFDGSYSETVTVPNESGLYAVLSFSLFGGGVIEIFDVNVTFDADTFFTLNANKSCPPTNTEAYMVHETLSRSVESITNGCLRVKSEYYGRTDSEPFSFDVDGCGGLRMLTSGLYIRQAETPKFFAAPKDLLEGLWAVDNIGFGFEEDSIPGKSILRVEKAEYFYKDEEIMECDGIPNSSEDIEESRHYSKINVGYRTWEVENINGLDEINSTREYGTGLDTVSSTLDIVSNLVTGSYPIEITRQQSFADSGGADTKFDNETFMVSLLRNAYGFEVEQGIENASGVYSPATVYNYRLSPIHNLMRWYRSILPSFATQGSEAEIKFNAGTGNFTASGQQESEFCKIENSNLQQNTNIYTTKFAISDDYRPLWRNELIPFEYPMSVADYKRIKDNPYGYISYQCGNGEFAKGWIKEIRYRPAQGKATITLRKKY